MQLYPCGYIVKFLFKGQSATALFLPEAQARAEQFAVDNHGTIELVYTVVKKLDVPEPVMEKNG